MATCAGGIQGFPDILLVALYTSHFAMVLVQRIAAHSIVVEPQEIAFPTLLAVALGAVNAQDSLVGVIQVVAGGALVFGPG